jgi:hypothetical protein
LAICNHNVAHRKHSLPLPLRRPESQSSLGALECQGNRKALPNPPEGREAMKEVTGSSLTLPKGREPRQPMERFWCWCFPPLGRIREGLGLTSRTGVAAIKRGDEEKRLRFDNSPRRCAPPKPRAYPRTGVAVIRLTLCDDVTIYCRLGVLWGCGLPQPPNGGSFPHHRSRGESPTCYARWLIPSLYFRNPFQG